MAWLRPFRFSFRAIVFGLSGFAITHVLYGPTSHTSDVSPSSRDADMTDKTNTSTHSDVVTEAMEATKSGYGGALLQKISTLERHRPIFHFTPLKNWMNDPNGMFYKDSVYHLYYQHNPKGNTWGPTHWGHATTRDLVHWKHHNKVLSPDRLGHIFSGSAVVDLENTSGMGLGAVVAFFTHSGVSSGGGVVQVQSIAYSTDGGFTFTKYYRNPVLEYPGHSDFRDPKVFFDEVSKRWVMAVSGGNNVLFYGSLNMKTWKYLSKFDDNVGVHVLECPELFPIKAIDASSHHVLLVSVNRGGPNGGSGTRYFVGSWSGAEFLSKTKQVLWLDYGSDNYAGVSWNGVGDGTFKRYLGWMSNWMYANMVPTTAWRSAMTLPRDIRLCKPCKAAHAAISWQLCSIWPKEVLRVFGEAMPSTDGAPLVGLLEMTFSTGADAQVHIASKAGDHIHVVFKHRTAQVILNRSASTPKPPKLRTYFQKLQKAPWFNEGSAQIVLDVGSMELLADGGRTVMTTIFYPKTNFDRLRVSGAMWTWRYFVV